ncbi:MAG: CRISPR system precrRNA processing endoribonuclease RAMP protein Cas6 [Chloroflexota bacterium]
MIPVTVLRVDVSGRRDFDLGHAPGSSLRGAFYAALGTLYDTRQSVTPDDWEENPVGWLLRLQDDTGFGGKDVPRPLSIRPPLAVEGSNFSFGLAFYGRARHPQILSMVISALPMMGQLGVGRGRQVFTVDKVSFVDPITAQARPLVDTDGTIIASLPDAPVAATYHQMANLLCQDQLTVEFLTPTRIIQQKRLVHQPMFRPWVQRLLERTRNVSEVYMEQPVWVPFKELLAQADKVVITQDDTHWRNTWSGSRRDGMMKPLGGYVGRVSYSGPVADLMPYILLGQSLQVGKNTIKGCGWYRVVYQWSS